MDRASRFQNPMPLSSGGYSKPPPIQNDGVGMKPLPPLILDRFRAMVKEREEELRVYSGGKILNLTTDEIVRIYEMLLSELTVNLKPIITDLTIIAGEQRAHGEGIADAICARIIEVSVDLKLPSLYLLDSIVKNIGKEYIKYFSDRLPEVFCESYEQVHPSMHPAMRHLFGTWSTHFPLSVLQKIEAQLQFSPAVNGQSSRLSSSKTSGSPRPPNGIHINPKYFEAQQQFGHSTIDAFGTEGVSSTARAGPTTSALEAVKKSTARIMRSSSPYRIVHPGSISPSVEELGVESSPKSTTVRASPSRPGIDYGLGIGKVMGVNEDTSEWQNRNWQGSANQQLQSSAAYKYNSSGLDLRRPRFLISAYGMDEREKKSNHNCHTAEPLDSNGADHNGAIRTWQNTEEEEFDWEDMTPAMADRRQSGDIYSSLPLGNLTARQSFTTNHPARLVTDYGVNFPKAQLYSATNPFIADDVANISNGHDKNAGVLSNAAVPNDFTSRIPPNFTREPLILPHQLSQTHVNAKEGGLLSESKSFLTAGQQNPPLIGHFSNTDVKLCGPASVSSFSPTYNSPASEIRSVDAAGLAKAWNPLKQNSHMMPSVSALPPHMQIRGQFNMKNNAFADQIHSEQHLASTRGMPQSTLPPIPTIRPVNMQNNAQPPLVQPNSFMAREARQNYPFSSSAPIPSNAMVPPLNHGYLAQPQGPPFGATSSNLVRGLQSSFTILNAPNVPFHVPRGPFPGTTQALPIGQNVGHIGPTPPAGPALSGLINSLLAQGLISVTKQDSVGVDFDQDNLKVRHETIIKALYNDLPRQCTTCGLRFKTQEEHSKHMDWHVNKNRTLKNRKTKPSPKWFVSKTMWLSGAEALGTEAAPGFLPAENTVEKEEDEELAVPADEDQNACALCGEPFDDYYSDETEEWMYKGAVYMYAPAGGLTVGMDRSQLGPIVHAKCRPDSHGVPSEDLTKDERELTEDGRRRKKLRS